MAIGRDEEGEGVCSDVVGDRFSGGHSSVETQLWGRGYS